jgi:hypothetical protein
MRRLTGAEYVTRWPQPSLNGGVYKPVVVITAIFIQQVDTRRV